MVCGYQDHCCLYRDQKPGLCLIEIDKCPLYQALEENARLKKQIAAGGLEDRAKGDEIFLGLKEFN